MSDRSRAIQIGSISAWVISDYEIEISEERIAALFKQDAERMVKALRETVYPKRASRNVLLLNMGGTHVLIDSGIGTFDAQYPGYTHQELRELGVAPEAIDMVILTHFHMDHFGGLLNADGSAAFPNARLVTGQREYDLQMSEENLAAMDPNRANALRNAIGAYQDRLELVDDDREIAPGIRLNPVPGHTAGQNAVLIESDGVKLLHAADAIHYPIQLNQTDAILGFDSLPEVAAATRSALLERADREELLILPYHFPFPGVGRIHREDDQYVWEPS